MNKKRNIIVAIILVILIGITWAIVYYTRSKDDAVSVKTEIIGKGNIKSYLNTTGVIKAKSIRDYYGSQLKVTGINFKVGDKVKKGDVLISYDNSDLQNAVKQAQIQYNNTVLQREDLLSQSKKVKGTIKNLDNEIKDIKNKIQQLKNSTSSSISTIEGIKSTISGWKGKFSKEEISEANILDASEKNLKLAQTENSSNTELIKQLSTALISLESQRNSIQPISEEKIKQMDNAVSLAKLALDSANSKLNTLAGNITADFDGTVTSINANIGAVSNPTSAAITIEDLSNLKVVVSLGKSDASKVKLEQVATIRSNGKEYKGKVSFISPSGKKGVSGLGAISAAPSSDVTMDAEIELLNSDENLKVEFDVDVDILTAEKTGVIVVPTEAIKAEKGGKYVIYTVSNDKKVSEHQVEVGIQSDINAEIVSGIKTGDRVILNPSAMVKQGVTVKTNAGGSS
ncbi:efflux RND transporter periplasmic adaptor subunit [Clostridium sp. C8-1-8]|uniref:efflux RND transporter periplasmic adaptor subunit n=1 Tax=Clostridium sp. C8-1-8 TaxID=2698831 RepID=UPI00136E99B0|nr:efflux RND transporter periplasmic adaptor subunit [Clostridium sp. C8-1-8]